MKLSETSIRRPVLASMMSAALVLFGVIGYSLLSVREFPDIDPPIISVTTVLPGANPRVMESAVTDRLEEELSTTPGLRTLTSSSGEQVSNITLEFNLERPVEEAAQDVRDRVSRVRGFLPEDILEPVIAKQEADANPFFWLALRGPNYDLLQLSDIADRLVVICDPMLATANSAIAAVDLLKRAGAPRIKFMCLLAAPEGVRAFTEAHPDVPLWTAAIDKHLDSHAYIVPGLGDAGDRLFGTK